VQKPQDPNGWQAAAPDPPPTNWPATPATAPPANRVASDRDPPNRVPTDSPLRPAAPHTQVAISSDGKPDAQDGSVAIQINPAIRNQFLPPDGQGIAPAGNLRSGAPAIRSVAVNSQFPGLPPGERPRMVNSRVFALEYDVESVGPSGIKQVELWGTHDGGRNWKRYAVDEKKHSPITVTVEEEGIYGFRIVVQSGAGLGGKPPQSGDLPEIWIGVDLTKPNARIIATDQEPGTDLSHLRISWEANDAMLAARPISLSFSETPGGPWRPIASGLENAGRYSWAVDSRTPPRVYLRLEARDEAGNVGVYETPQPISLDRTSPSARIRDVHPVGQSGQRLPEQNYLR
jgi:hypothetical protein